MEKTVWQTMASRPDMDEPARKKVLPLWAKQVLMGAAGGAIIGLLIGLGFFI